MSEPSIRVLLVKAGPTQWEEQGRMGGSTDVPMAPAGLARIRDVALGLEQARLGPICCGPDEASRSAAEALVASCGGKVKVIDDLAEIHLGLWEGMPEADLREKCPTTYRQWMDDPTTVAAPEGESVEDVQTRVLEAVSKVLERAKPSGGAVVFVLRPIALALVHGALERGVHQGLWHAARNGYSPQWITLTRTDIEQVRELARTPVRR